MANPVVISNKNLTTIEKEADKPPEQLIYVKRQPKNVLKPVAPAVVTKTVVQR